MQIVIDIPVEVYGLLKYFEKGLGLNDKKEEDDVKTALIRAVVTGTPLPKGHGDLIDVNRKITVPVYDEQYEEWGEEILTVREALNRWSDEGITVKDVVILADKAESEE